MCFPFVEITLPTFILECRSLLEMYADFYAHPNLFLRYEVIILLLDLGILSPSCPIKRIYL